MYKKITVNGKKWIVSKECARKLEFLDKEITYDGEISGSDLVGKNVTIPHLNKSIPMIQASFVESATGTGLVMSVPAHAPFDHQALVDFKKDQPLGSEYQLIKPISIISTEGYGDFSAKETCEKFEIKNQDDPKLEEATDEIYGKEFYSEFSKKIVSSLPAKKYLKLKIQSKNG